MIDSGEPVLDSKTFATPGPLSDSSLPVSVPLGIVPPPGIVYVTSIYPRPSSVWSLTCAPSIGFVSAPVIVGAGADDVWAL